MKKVTFLINSLTQGGAEKIALQLYLNLSNSVNVINFVTLTNEDFYKKEIKKHVINHSNKITKTTKFMSLAKYFRGNNDVVLCFSLDLACYLYILRVLNIFKGEVICRFINNPDNEIGTSLINKIKKRFLFYVLKKCDLVICQSDAMKDLLISKYEFNNNKTVRIYNPISIANNNESSFEQTDIEILKLLFVGRLSEQKNLDDIIRISQLLRDKGILFLWKVVGKGPLENTFKDLIREHNFQESIVMCGSSHDIENYYKWADITTLVSHYEGLPNVLLESISHRTPCVSYDCPTGPSEIIIHEKNGVLVPQYDVDNFYQSLIRVKELNLKNDNIENTLMKFSEKKVCDEYYKILFKR